MVRIFTSRILENTLSNDERDALISDFKRYKETGELPDTFGRDEHYDHPYTLSAVQSEELRHLHINENGWPLNVVQWGRTSDTHLVYCQGFIDSESYALLTYLSPDAHNQARNNDIMLNLAKSAGRFRDEH